MAFTGPKFTPWWENLPINFLGCTAIGVSLAVMALVRLFIPDEAMAAAAQPLSNASSGVISAYVLGFMIWFSIYARVPGSPALTLIGANLSGLGLVANSVDLVMHWNPSSLPFFAGFAVFTLFLIGHTIWLRKSARNIASSARPSAARSPAPPGPTTITS